MHSQKIHNKKLILPVLIFLAGCLALAAGNYRGNMHRNTHNKTPIISWTRILWTDRRESD